MIIGESYTFTCKYCSSSFEEIRRGFNIKSVCQKCAKNKVRINFLNYKEKNPDKIKRNHKVSDLRDPERTRTRWLKYRYGISSEDYNLLLESQNHKCAICKKEQSEKFCVDHCHQTKKIRGLLCHKCNTTLGFVNDDLEILHTMIVYLKNSLVI